MSNFNKVKQFHDKFGLPYEDIPRKLPEEEQRFRILCLREELEEYETAVASEDLEEQFDALIDLVYFALGTAHRNGFEWDKGFERVHKANMLKTVDSFRQRRGFELEVTKPIDWKPPVLSDLIAVDTCSKLKPNQFTGKYTGLITLDGVDASGKTTLAKRIIELTGGEYIHLTWSPELEKVMHNYRTSAIHYAATLATHTVVVLERPWLSHPIYSEVYRDGKMEDYTSWRTICQLAEDVAILSVPEDMEQWYDNYLEMVDTREELFAEEENELMIKVFHEFDNVGAHGEVTDKTIYYDMFEVENNRELDQWILTEILPKLKEK
jgi:predicted HAD superfamily Cof-like phosphohydrolase